MSALRFSTSVLEQQRTLSASNASNLNQDAAAGEQSPKVRKLLRKSSPLIRGPGSPGAKASPQDSQSPQRSVSRLAPADKENQPRPQPLHKRAPSAGTLWTQLQVKDRQIEELRAECTELERREAETRQLKAAIAKPAVEKADAEAQTSRMPNQQDDKVAADMVPAICGKALESYAQGVQQGFEDMESQLANLTRQTTRNEAYLKKLHGHYYRSASASASARRVGASQENSSTASNGVDHVVSRGAPRVQPCVGEASSPSTGATTGIISNRLLAMRLVHGAVVHSLLSSPEQPQVLSEQQGIGEDGGAGARVATPDELSELRVLLEADFSIQREELEKKLESISAAHTDERQKREAAEVAHADEIQKREAMEALQTREAVQAAQAEERQKWQDVEVAHAEELRRREAAEAAHAEERAKREVAEVAHGEELRQREAAEAKVRELESWKASWEATQGSHADGEDHLKEESLKRECLQLQCKLAAADAQCKGLLVGQEALQIKCAKLQDELDIATTERDELQLKVSSRPHAEVLGSEAAIVSREEDLLSQNNQLVLTLQLLKQDCELLEAENRSLKESAAMFEQNFDRVAGQHARLMGHTNHKQKIQHTVRLKEENTNLRTELTNMKKRVLQLQSIRRGESLVDALAPLSAAVRPQDAQVTEPRAGTPKNGERVFTPKLGQRQASGSRALQASRSGSRSSLGRAPAAGERDPFFGGNAAESGTISRCTSENLEQRKTHCCNHERTLERISVDFRHFTTLIERAVVSEDISGKGSTDLSYLLQRLRDVVVSNDPLQTKLGF